MSRGLRIPPRLAQGALLLLVLYAGRARAAELSWVAPPACGDASSVRTQVEQLAQRSLAAVESVDFEVRIEHRRGQPWHASLRTRARPSGPERVRDLFGASCQAAKDALAVAMAMTITASEPGPEPHAPSVGPSPSAPPPAVPPGLQPSSPQLSGPVRGAMWNEPVRTAVAVGLALDAGILPAPSPGATLELTLRTGALRLTALGSWFLARAARLAGSSDGADFGLGLGALLGCLELAHGSIHGLGCGGFELGWLMVEPVNLARDRGNRFVFGPRAELGLIWQFAGAFGLSIRAGVTFPLRRDRFLVDDQAALHQPSAASFRGTVNLEYAL